jgi:hypothetical protein
MPLEELRALLGSLSWDCSRELVPPRSGDVVAVLDRFLSRHLQASEVVDWADSLEVSDDVSVESDAVREARLENVWPSRSEGGLQRFSEARGRSRD